MFWFLFGGVYYLFLSAVLIFRLVVYIALRILRSVLRVLSLCALILRVLILCVLILCVVAAAVAAAMFMFTASFSTALRILHVAVLRRYVFVLFHTDFPIFLFKFFKQPFGVCLYLFFECFYVHILKHRHLRYRMHNVMRLVRKFAAIGYGR